MREREKDDKEGTCFMSGMVSKNEHRCRKEMGKWKSAVRLLCHPVSSFRSMMIRSGKIYMGYVLERKHDVCGFVGMTKKSRAFDDPSHSSSRLTRAAFLTLI